MAARDKIISIKNGTVESNTALYQPVGRTSEDRSTRLIFAFDAQFAALTNKRVVFRTAGGTLLTPYQIDSETVDGVTTWYKEIPGDCFDAVGQMAFSVYGTDADGRVFATELKEQDVREALTPTGGTAPSVFVSITDACIAATTAANTAAQTANDAAADCRETEQATKDAEAIRVTAEDARVLQASTDHQTASEDHVLAGTDHTTAQSDHTTAGTDHTIAVSDHQTASTDHTNALTDRAAITPTITQMGNLGNPSTPALTNLVTNGDFSNGTTGYIFAGGTGSVDNNTLAITGDGTTYFSVARANSLTPIPSIGNKLYMRANVRVRNASASYISLIMYTQGVNQNAKNIISPAIDTWYVISGIITLQPDTGALARPSVYTYYVDTTAANGKVTEVQYVSCIDLTATFGAGNEPTAAQMDRLLSYFPNAWFGGNANITDILQCLIAEKASKVQEDWITPTFINGWTQQNASAFPVGYFKDSLGIVHLRGIVTSGTYATPAFVFATGYRPLKVVYPVSRTSSTIAFPKINTDGSFTPTESSYSGWISLDGITFKAEA